MFIAWILGAFVVGFFGTDTKYGYWGVFLFSLLLSPLVGILIALLSSTKKTNKVTPYVAHFRTAQQAENRGDIEDAILNYKNTILEINKLPFKGDKKTIDFRMKHLDDANAKLIELQNN